MVEFLLIDDLYEPEPNSGCWLWIGAYNRQGYGRAGTRGLAHRAMYEAVVGPIPDGKELHHKCEVVCCVNPAHLEPVTRREHNDRGSNNAAAVSARKTHCKHGHPFSKENTRINTNGSRSCRACDRIKSRIYHDRKQVPGRAARVKDAWARFRAAHAELKAARDELRQAQEMGR